MARPRILNPERAGPGHKPMALSQEILAEARALGGPEQCAPLDRLTTQLHGVAPERIEGDPARIAFWVNLYNALILHCLCLRPVRGSLLRHLRTFDKIAYQVGSRDYPLNLIENGLLRRNRRQPYRLRRPMRGSDPRLALAPSRLDQRIHFALNCGARSCPAIRSYEPETLDDQLELSTRTYLEAESAVDPKACRITLPRLMRLYKRDFGTREEQLAFAARHVPAIADCLERDGARPRVAYGRFDWTVAAGTSA
jgi:Protein of unknown function, DUF547